METKQKVTLARQSNIELVRIVAMLMIIAFHITCHCVRIQLLDPDSIQLLQNGLFDHPLFYAKLLILETVQTLGITGNGIFMLITGYFLISKNKINLLKSIKKIMRQLAFACGLLVILSTLYYTNVNNSAIGLLGIDWFNITSWFAGYYLVIIIIASLYLNKFIAKLNKSQYLTILAILFSFISVNWMGGLLSGLSENLRVLATGIFFYLLGGFIKIYNPFAKVKLGSIITLIGLTFAIVWLSYYNKTISNINTYFLYEKTEPFKQIVSMYSNFSIVPIILSICIFEIGTRVKISSSKIINFIGGSTFMIYLIHDNSLFHQIWQNQDWITVYYHDPIRFCQLLVTWTFITFGIGFIAYLLFLLIERIIASKTFRKVIYKN